MSIKIKITSYSIIYSSNSFAKRIGLYSNKAGVAQLNFYAAGNALPADSQTTVGGKPYYMLNYHLDSFANCLDMLRTRTDVFLFYSGSGGGFENGIQWGI